MDHDDDARGGLDDLSRLFDTGTEPLPAVPPTEPSRPVPASRDDAPLPAVGQPLPPASVPTPAVAPSFGTPASGTPVAGPPPSAPPVAPAPYPPPPLVPTAPLSTSATAPPPAAPPASAPEPLRSPAAVPAPTVAPAFGGVPIAALRTSGSDPVAAPVRTPAPAPVPVVAEPDPAPSVVATATVEPPAAAAFASAPTSSTPPTPAPVVDPPEPYTGQGPLLPGGELDDIVDDAEVARPTLAEKIFFVLTIVLPPIGLVGTAVAAVGSLRRRGWVIGLLRVGLVIGIVMSVVSAGGAYAGYKVIRVQQAHAQTVAASTAFCAAFAKDKTLGTADGGWPQPAASIPDSLTAMQGYVDRWTALAKVSPEGIQQQVSGVAAAGAEIIKSVQVQRTIDDAQNRPVLVSAVTAAGIADWRAEYCE